MAKREDDLRTPGELLGLASEFNAGRGSYCHDGKIYASLVGIRHLIEAKQGSDDLRPTIEIRREKERDAVPEAGSTVTAKITKVQARMASADIVCVGPRAVKEKFTGIVRQQDVRLTEIDKVDMHSSFRPGDIIRAEVISLGDSRAYYLSTAKNELGVVSAVSVAGMPKFFLVSTKSATMVAVSWQEMQCPLTNQREPRKVAKVVT
ncbi:hypothetical protein SELMODRAFT_178307 [Selaginella moellendorffii]|uniref:S1 motif domain-containing protein n=1 Tax=Selaginella moellendorffii TaxID=88036 RepID=D8SB86_SELML|nr:hypothetical protein SELMODRAFT_178307 [Selaginella moellendorffii]